MEGPRRVLRPTNAGRVTEDVVESPLRVVLAVMFCWSPEERFARNANMLSLSNRFNTGFSTEICGSNTVLIVSACGRLTLLLPRSRFRFVGSSIGKFCSKLFTSGASLMVCDQVYDALA